MTDNDSLIAAIHVATANAARDGKQIRAYDLAVGIMAGYPKSGLNVEEIFRAIREGIAQGSTANSKLSGILAAIR